MESGQALCGISSATLSICTNLEATCPKPLTRLVILVTLDYIVLDG